VTFKAIHLFQAVLNALSRTAERQVTISWLTGVAQSLWNSRISY